MPASIALALAEELTRTIVNCGEEATDALIQLIRAVADPDGDKHKAQVAWVVIKTAMPFSSKFGELCELDTAEEEPEQRAASAR